MHTRCPNCDTVFRVTPPQIKARAGTVRCGQCHFVFNALDTLEDVAPPFSEPTEAAHVPMDSLGEITTEDIESVRLDADDAITEAVDEPASREPIENAEPSIEGLQANESPLDAHDYLAAPLPAVTETPTRRWPWITGSAIAVVLLLVQIAYYYRVELAAMRPAWRPMLMSLCTALRCDVPRPRQIDAISIDSSDLRPDAQHPGHLMLSAALRSKSPLAQEWPTLELTLTDVSDRRLAVRQFAATEYLPKDRNNAMLLAAGFPPNGEIPVTLALDIDGLQAAGYRLYVFYP